MRSDVVDLYVRVLDDPNLTFRQKRIMLNEVRKVMAPEQNRWNFRYVIIPLAFTLCPYRSTLALRFGFVWQARSLRRYLRHCCPLAPRRSERWLPS
jgi:hypothetical protein